jgi:hypothetical protein
MAKATKAEVTTVTLELDEEEAGYLRDLLFAHVAGSLINPGQPLGRISRALAAAEVKRISAYNYNEHGAKGAGHACLYRTRADAASD